MNNIPIELLMYQLGGTLPSIVRDSVSPRELAQLSYSPNFTQPQGLQQLDTSNLDDFTKEQRLRDDLVRREKLDAERIRVADKNADRQIKADSIKGLQNMVKLMKDETDPMSGIPTFLPGAKSMIETIKTASGNLSSALNDAQMNMLNGADITPELFSKIQASRDNITKITTSNQYLKLMSVKPTLDAVMKDYNNHAAGDGGKLVDEEGMKAYFHKLNEYVLSDNGMDPPKVPDTGLIISTKEFEDTMNLGIKAFIENNKADKETFQGSRVAGGTMTTTTHSNLGNPETFVDNYVELVKQMKGGEAYMKSIGGEGALRTYINNKAAIIDPAWGTNSSRVTKQEVIMEAAPRSSGGSSADGLSKADQVAVDTYVNFLAQYGLTSNNPTIIKQNATRLYPIIGKTQLSRSDIETLINLGGLVDISGKQLTTAEIAGKFAKRSGEIGFDPDPKPKGTLTQRLKGLGKPGGQ